MNPINRDEFAQLLHRSDVKPRLRRDLRYVPEEISTWEARDFLAITSKSRSEGVIIAPFASQAVFSFRLQPRAANSNGRVEAIICDFCATWQRGTYSATIAFQKEKRSISFLVCADLACSLHVRSLTPAAILSRTQLREDMTTDMRIARLRANVRRILTNIETRKE